MTTLFVNCTCGFLLKQAAAGCIVVDLSLVLTQVILMNTLNNYFNRPPYFVLIKKINGL